MGLFRKTYSVPLPADATPCTVTATIRNRKCQVPGVRYTGPDGKLTTARLSRDGRSILLESPTWYAKIDGEAVPLSSNKTVAERIFAEKVRQSELKRAGVVSGCQDWLTASIRDTLAEWRQSLLDGGTSQRQANEQHSRCRCVFEGIGAVTLADLLDCEGKVSAYLALRRRGRDLTMPKGDLFRKVDVARLLGIQPNSVTYLVRRHRLEAVGKDTARRFPRATVEALLRVCRNDWSIQTANHHLQAAKQFCGWLVRRQRLPRNPLASLQGGNVRVDRRHDRQSLTPQQTASLLLTTRESSRVYRGLTGEDRYHLYLTALATGFRRGELALLTVDSFRLQDSPPTVTIPAKRTKNKTLTVQPISSKVAGELQSYLTKRSGLVWPGTWHQRGAEMLRLDLEAADIPYIVEGPDGPLYADLHALRHTFIGLLDRPDVTLKQAMQLARHSDPKLTMARYGKARLHDLGMVVDGMGIMEVRESKRPRSETG